MSEKEPETENFETDTDGDDIFTVKKVNVLSEEKIRDIKSNFRKHDRFQFIDSQIRNVLFCGKTKSGKTTCFHVLMDPCHVPLNFSIFSQTKEATFRPFALNDGKKKETVNYVVSIIDSPGLFEVRAQKKDVTSDEQLLKIIGKCLESNICYIHVVVIFVAFEQGIAREDLKAINEFLTMFDDGNSKEKSKHPQFVLCVTRADGKTNKWQEEITKQLKESEDLSPLIEKYNIQIKFMGCVDHESRKFASEEELHNEYVRVYNFRKNLLESIFKAEEKVPLISLNVAKKKVNDCKKSYEKMKQIMEEMMKRGNTDTGSFKELVSDYLKERTFVEENSYLNNVNEFIPVVLSFEETKKRFVEFFKINNPLLVEMKLEKPNLNPN